MKEATGELNATVVVVITIGLLSTFFFTVIWPRLNDNLHANSKCSDAYCSNEAIKNCTKNDKGVCIKVNCKYKDKNNKEHDITCPYKG